LRFSELLLDGQTTWPCAFSFHAQLARSSSCFPQSGIIRKEVELLKAVFFFDASASGMTWFATCLTANKKVFINNPVKEV
jgi:hypothetical protein